MQQLSDQTDVAFIARKLRLACFALSHQSVYNTDYRFGLLEMLLEHVRNMAALQQIPAVGLYYFCYLSLTDAEGERYFIQFKTMLFACTDQLPVDEQRNLHLLAINFCIRRINQLESRYSRKTYELYKSALQANLLLENNQLSHFAYNNIAAIAVQNRRNGMGRSFHPGIRPDAGKKAPKRGISPEYGPGGIRQAKPEIRIAALAGSG